MKRKSMRVFATLLCFQIICGNVVPGIYAAPSGEPESAAVYEKPLTEEEQQRKEEREREKEEESRAQREEDEEELKYLLSELENEKSQGSEASQEYIKELERDIAKLQKKLGLPVTVGKSNEGDKSGASSQKETDSDPRAEEDEEDGDEDSKRPAGPSSSSGFEEFDVDDREEEDDVDIKPPSSQEKLDIDDEVGDLVVSDKVYTTAGKTRVTEVYSVNNMYADCYFRPKAEDIPMLGERVCKVGQYTAAYTGFFNIGWKEAAKPRGEQSRALEILGYDFLYTEEKFDTKTKKYSRVLLGTKISQQTAIMNIYKALGLEQYDIKMYHQKGAYNKGNSPTGSLLGRDTLIYKIRDCNSSVTDTFDGYETYVFTTRTNPLLYMRKLQNDFNIPLESDKSATMTLEDFIIMTYKMMSFYGEPVLSKQETNQLLQAYGAEVPAGMSAEFQEAWMYLKARGVLNIDNDRLNGNLTKTDMFEILMCVKDRDSRTNYKEVQLTYELNTDIVNKGYYPVTTTVTEVDEINISGEVSYEDCTVYDYMIPINDYSRFVGQTGEEVNSQFISDNPEACNLTLPGSAYLGVVDDRYYHFVIPIDSPAVKDGYYRVDTLGSSDKPGAIMLLDGGGIYKFESSTGAGAQKLNYFKRRPFNDSEFPDYVDRERKAGKNDFDYDSWGTDKEYIYVEDEDDTTKPEPDIEEEWGVENWQGPWIRETITEGQWFKDESVGKWRYYTMVNEGEDREMLQGAGYLIGSEASGNIADNLFMFDNNGWMVTGWYQEGHLWAYFDENGHLTHDTTITVDGVDFEFDQWGWWIDNEYNQPEDRIDDWGDLTNMEGSWQYDETKDNWWFILSGDGNWLSDGVYMINDKYYCFDGDGWMYTGWYEYGDGWYYFYPKEGHMAINATVEGKYRVGQNGRLVGRVKTSAKEKAKNIMYAIADMFTPLVSYAAPVAETKNSLGALVSVGNTKKFRVKIYDGTVEESRDDIINKVKATGVRNPRFEQSPASWTGQPYLTIISELNAERIASLLTFKTNADNLTIVNTQMAITQFGGTSKDDVTMLVPFEELVEAGLFSNKVNMSEDGNELQLWGISSTTRSDDIMINKRHSFGEVRLNKADNTIMVGPTIYTMRANQQLWYIAPADEQLTANYSWVDSEGNPLEFANNGNGGVLYVDFRVVYGWAANEVKFYQMNTSADENITGGKQLVVSVGKAVDNDGNAVEVTQAPARTRGARTSYGTWNSVRVIPGYTADGHSAMLAANSYQLATWSLLVLNSQTGGEDIRLVTYYPKLAFDQLSITPPTGQDSIDGLKTALPKGRKIIDSPDYVCRHTKLAFQANVSKGSECEVGKWYRDKDFGYIYILPTINEWNSQDGYKKWLANEWSLPMCGETSVDHGVTDMSMPALEGPGIKYGDFRVAVTTTKMIPPIASLSRLLYKEPVMSNRTLESASSTRGGSGQTIECYFFGIHSMTKTSSGQWGIDGIGTSANKQFLVKEDEVGEIKFVAPIKIYSRAYSGTAASTKEYDIYTLAPSNATYVEATGENSTTGGHQFIGGEPLNVFRDFNKFTLEGFMKWLDGALATVILFAVEVLPIFLFTCSLVVFGFGLMADFKGVKWFCNKFFDPIKFLTRGAKDINTVGGIKFFLCVLLITVGFALCVDGNIIRIFQWLFEVIGTYLNMLGNIG